LLSLDAAIAKPPALRSLHLEGDSIALALEKADAITRDHRSSGVFEQVIEQVLSEETTKSSQLTGKFGKCMSKVYPVAKVALEVVAFGSDVSFRLIWPGTASSHVYQGRFISAAEGCCKWTEPSHICEWSTSL
jgi:hypothetical protein